jgi:hypothetical protein
MCDVHPGTIENLVACRDQLIFALTDQFPPPDDVAKPMWETYNLLVSTIETMKAQTGYAEREAEGRWTVYAPRTE